MTTHPPPDEFLGKHVKYEIDMLRETLTRIPRSTDPVITFALMESYCTHARGLIEFLSKKKKHTAWDYVGSSPPYKPFDGKGGRVADLNTKVNQQVSHLIYGRTDDNSKKLGDAERAELYQLIRDAVAHFKTCLKPEYRTINIGELPPLGAAAKNLGRARTTTSVPAISHTDSTVVSYEELPSPSHGPTSSLGPQRK